MVIVFQNGKFYEKGPKGQEPVSIIVVNGRLKTALGRLGVSKSDADKIIASLSPEEKAKALNVKNFLREFVEKREL